jgi:Tol biopolymer transport system component
MKTTKMVVILVLVLGLATELANADFTFGTPTNLGPPVNTSSYDALASISADGLSLYFTSDRSGGSGSDDLYVAMRVTKEDDWGTPVNLGPTVNSSGLDHCARISADGLSLYLSSWRPGGYGQMDIWVTTRETTEDDWGTPVNLGPTVNSSSEDWGQSISTDGLTLFFESNRPGGSGGWDIYVTTRATKDDDWSAPVNLGPTVNSAARDGGPYISADGLELFFFSDRPGGYGNWDLWVTTRETTNDPWSAPVNLGPTVNSLAFESVPSISADGRELYFSEGSTALRPGSLGGGDIWQVSIIPIVDFNGDGIVDSADMCIMVDHWHTDEPFYDIGPMPWGDGIVDVQDLIVLAEYLMQDVNDPTLVAHWALDEIEGDIASDSANDNDGTVYGDPAWQPEDGIVDGALQLDGIDDYVSTPFVLNPADGKFSVFAWIKGGGAGQVVIAQENGLNWLRADTLEGNLMTELKGPGRGATELLSQTIVTDGNWHRIGLVWDGSNRTLYVDDIAVAEDTQTNLEASENGLYIGAGKAMEQGSFWSGLIDDVRIYNRAVRP